MFGTKLLAMGSAAANMFDAEMMTKNIDLSKQAMIALGFSEEEMKKGVKMSTSMLTKLVKTDLDVALNEISKLYQKGSLSFETLSKMFGCFWLN